MLSVTRHDRLALLRRALAGVRTLARLTYVTLLFWSGGLRRAKRELLKRGAIVILTFHRVLDDEAYQETNSLPGIIIRDRTFRKLVKYVVLHNTPVRLDAAVPCRSERLRVAITFDDGWRDNHSSALPIAQSFGLPFTVFLCPKLVGQNTPFWPEQASALLRSQGVSPTAVEEVIEALKRQSDTERDAYLESLRNTHHQNGSAAAEIDQLLTRDEIGEMRCAGVSFGSHTQTHQILTMIAAESAAEELSQSKSTIEANVGEPCLTFAYPNGNSH